MRYLSHARPVVRDLSSVCPTVRLPTLSHPTKGRRLGLPQLHRILLLLLRRLRALRPGLPRPPRPQVSQRPQGLLQEGHRSPVEHVLGTSRVMWLRGSRDVVDHGCPAALRQASCRHGSGGRGAETIYSNNGPRVIREAIDFHFCGMRPALFPLCKLALAPHRQASADACASDCLRLR